MTASENDLQTNWEHGRCRTATQMLVEVCHRRSYEAGWWATRSTPSGTSKDLRFMVRNPDEFGEHVLAGALVAQKLALIHSEVSEALEGHRKDRMDEHVPDHKSITVELADAIIRICDLAGALNVDLGDALVKKMAYNLRRLDHKPEARAAAGGKGY